MVQKIKLLLIGLCKPFDVSLGSDGSPFIFYEKKEKTKVSGKKTLKNPNEMDGNMWWPICGQFFADNHYGAKLFCQQLGYDDGSVKISEEMEEDKDKKFIPMDSFMVGKCSENDTIEYDSLQRCTDGCNNRAIGGNCEKESCSEGKGRRVKIQCKGGKEQLKPMNSCKSKYGKL